MKRTPPKFNVLSTGRRCDRRMDLQVRRRFEQIENELFNPRAATNRQTTTAFVFIDGGSIWGQSKSA